MKDLNQKIFVAGPAEGHAELELAVAALKELGFSKIVTTESIFEDVDISDFELTEIMKPSIAEVVHCDEVLTLDGWDNDITAKNIVVVARMVHTPVTAAHVFIRKYQEAAQKADVDKQEG